MTLGKYRIGEIEAIAESLINEFYDYKIKTPVNIIKIIKKNNLNLEVVKFKDSNIIGFFNRTKHLICISQNIAYPRAAFTLAHELGHYLLHKDKEKEVFYRQDSYLANLNSTKKKETEANWFALSILMPKEEIEKDWELTDSKKIMPKLYAVSNTAIFWRLKNLNLI